MEWVKSPTYYNRERQRLRQQLSEGITGGEFLELLILNHEETPKEMQIVFRKKVREINYNAIRSKRIKPALMIKIVDYLKKINHSRE